MAKSNVIKTEHIECEPLQVFTVQFCQPDQLSSGSLARQPSKVS